MHRVDKTMGGVRQNWANRLSLVKKREASLFKAKAVVFDALGLSGK